MELMERMKDIGKGWEKVERDESPSGGIGRMGGDVGMM